MSFAQTHDTLWYSPKFKKLSMAARGLWVTCQSWCIGQLTDGLIPESEVVDIGGSDAQIRALVKSGLWSESETKDGEPAYQFHDWLHHNESAEKISTRRRRERERKADQRAKKKDQDLAQASGGHAREATKTSGESGGSFSTETPSDLRESESVPGGKEKEGKERELKGRGREAATPSPESTTEPEAETKDGNTNHSSASDSAPAPDNSASSSRNQEPVVDTSATKKEPSIASLGRRMGYGTPSDPDPDSLAHLPYKERKRITLEKAAERRKAQSA